MKRYVLVLLLFSICANSQTLLWAGRPRAPEHTLAKVVITEDVLKRFIAVYPQYNKLVATCKGEIEAKRDCSQKLTELLSQYDFNLLSFGILVSRITAAYGRICLDEAGMPVMDGMFGDYLEKIGQARISQKEMEVIKKFRSQLEKLFSD